MCSVPTGGGLSERNRVAKDIAILMGSLSKAIGGLGGFVAASRDFIDKIRLSTRSFWFSTSSTPGSMAAAAAAMEVIRSDEGSERRGRLERNARLMRKALEPLDVVQHRPDETSADWSPIIPIRLFDELRTALSWNKLRNAGMFVTPAIYPAVPLGKPILRVCMTSELSEDEVLWSAEMLTKELSWAYALIWRQGLTGIYNIAPVDQASVAEISSINGARLLGGAAAPAGDGPRMCCSGCI